MKIIDVRRGNLEEGLLNRVQNLRPAMGYLFFNNPLWEIINELEKHAGASEADSIFILDYYDKVFGGQEKISLGLTFMPMFSKEFLEEFEQSFGKRLEVVNTALHSAQVLIIDKKEEAMPSSSNVDY